MTTIRLGSRGSPLALAQSRMVAAWLERAHPGLAVPITIVRTEGDRNTDASLTAAGGKGLFVKELEDALLAGTIDLAVHSLKDLPTELPGGLTLAAIPKRHDARDALIARDVARLDALKEGALVATGSPRRQCQLKARRADLRFVAVRGNVDTRVKKLERGEFDALVLAVAGIERLGLATPPRAPIPTEICLPAPGQGALGLETRADDAETRQLVAALDDPAARAAVTAERAFLAELGAGCLAPAAAFAQVSGGRIVLEAMVGDAETGAVQRDTAAGPAEDAASLGASLAGRLS
ncbi:MAG TPA: hydroxymethylbilane synthase [Candidatus Polarisedimenticolaceae bacterium]|nr:hydroxymethylbilane synthase [Candidatus Polarisedimenticolaceae bacterium]